ncbi:hypothetical protein PIIN_03076 [Serendipita indica DSM 11827]|uniref:Uncharacterized protein n=1 Tax=Serendipita indica (strain DSM 11827) TaxID=1109443 RepID=G4TCX4_SERID|nr:hypothetical protein PIIN_03076 [Serendipita indica DSM 11827]
MWGVNDVVATYSMGRAPWEYASSEGTQHILENQARNQDLIVSRTREPDK